MPLVKLDVLFTYSEEPRRDGSHIRLISQIVQVGLVGAEVDVVIPHRPPGVPLIARGGQPVASEDSRTTVAHVESTVHDRIILERRRINEERRHEIS